ncbi:hypothetical protein [Xenorhabdus bovienii]|uniref:Uncharacterized protein n=1 Tax=Xenorhabdus bovienii str. feltiae Moldova TaxID=1398200 RepID=A0A077NUX5_XENBV|nr:hypothetical protein [Xenorhabdus bovienii]CDH01426.1 membrane hypothetical protein [Xenorhabdus bovienii str. feltiae Moldova]
MLKSAGNKGFWFFDGSDFFEFLRRTISLISPSVMVIFMVSLGSFFIQDKFGTDSFQYKFLLGSGGAFIVLVAVFFDLKKNFTGLNIVYLCKLLIFVATVFLCLGSIYVGVLNAVSLHNTLISLQINN